MGAFRPLHSTYFFDEQLNPMTTIKAKYGITRQFDITICVDEDSQRIQSVDCLHYDVKDELLGSQIILPKPLRIDYSHLVLKTKEISRK